MNPDDPLSPYLWQLPCKTCAARDCQDRGVPARACLPIPLQSAHAVALSHLSPDLPVLLNQLADFEIPARITQASDLQVPPYLPQIDPDSRLARRLDGGGALGLGRFVSEGGFAFDSGVRRAKKMRRMGIDPLILVASGRDPLLESVARDPDRFIEAIVRAGFDLVLGPAYSVYKGRPPLERIANRSRNLAIYDRLRHRGIQAIPAVGFADATEAAFVAGWIQSRRLSAVFVDLQGTESEWPEALDCLDILARNAGLSQLFVNGVGSPVRVLELRQIIRDVALVLTNASAFQLARSRVDYVQVGSSRYRRARTAASREALFRNYCAFYEGGADPYRFVSAQARML